MRIAIEITYLISSILFIFGIKFLGSPKTARKGNLYAAIGMFLAIAATLLDQQVLTYEWIIIGALIGSVAGLIMAYKTPMTGMPQMVGMLNGFGGGASTLVALSEYFKKNPNYPVDTGLPFNLPVDQGIAIILSLLIGGVTFTGSMIAFGKLQGLITGKVVK
ncbi:MAG TPA: NAD(P)(+) transhydrogenase (Re/Si-specific) subunit beta, partial [Ignavibacteriaceae bacterium]